MLYSPSIFMKGRETVDGAEREVLHASSEVSERRFYCGKQDLRMLGRAGES